MTSNGGNTALPPSPGWVEKSFKDLAVRLKTSHDCPHGVPYDGVTECKGCEAEEAKLVDELAALEHDQWIVFARSVLNSERLSKFRQEKWRALMVPYAHLSEVDKEKCRVFARKVVDRLHQLGVA